MKMYYIASGSIESYGMGVSQKIISQIDFFKDYLAIDVNFVSLLNSASRFKKIVGKIIPFFSVYNIDFINNVEEKSVVYMRHIPLDYTLIKMLEKLKRKKCLILLEIPTYPYDCEKKRISSKINLLYDRVFRNKLKRYVDRIVTYSQDEFIYDIKTIKISNAVNIDDGFRIKKSSFDDSIEIMAVAYFAFWHGYDRFINGLASYYKNGGERNIIFNLVGPNNAELKKYKDIVKREGLAEHVLFEGIKMGDELNKIYNRCKLGIDSLGRHRSGVYYNSTLKGKEYLLKGLPIVSGVKTELDDTMFKYYLRVPADDSSINISEIVDFYDKIYAEKDAFEIKKYIRNYAIENFSYEAVYKKIANYITAELCR